MLTCARQCWLPFVGDLLPILMMIPLARISSINMVFKILPTGSTVRRF